MAGLPVGSLYHTVCLDNLTEAFQEAACNMADSLAVSLYSVGFEMRRMQSIKQTSNQIVFDALMFVNRVAVIAGDEGKPLMLRHL